MINPIDHEEFYDAIILAGKRSPGKVTLSGHDREYEWDVKKVPGQKGATTTFKGDQPAKFTASFFLLRDESVGVDDFEEWPAFVGLIESAIAGKTPKGLDIYHPDLVINKITTVVPTKIGGVVHDGKGGQTIAIEFLEYSPPKPAGGTLSKTATKDAKKTDPDAALLAELDGLTKQYAATPWG